MIFDWFTVAAQVVNFLALVWLLKHFLYKPILNAIDSREKNIAETLADANQQKEIAKTEYETFAHKNAELEAARQELMTKAENSAEQERQHLRQQTLTEMASLREQIQQSVERDIAELQHTIGEQAQQQIFAITRKLLIELANAPLEDQLSKHFIQQLTQLKPDAKKPWAMPC